MGRMGRDDRASSSNRVVVGLSGGVDSAVTAALLQEQGFEVSGLTLLTWRAPTAPPAERSLAQAAAVAEALGIPYRVQDVQRRFYQEIVVPFVNTYAQGRTPNPCVLCNPTLKFAALLEEADRVGARWIATGHYARVVHPQAGPTRLLRARDRQKDQSYALYRLTQHHLSHLLLPLGEVESKSDVRNLARQLRLPGAEQHDSQDLCFMGRGDYRSLFETLWPEALKPGPIYDEAGEKLGEHRGLACYTVGQRSGLDIAAPERLYVLRLIPEENALIVGPEASALRLESLIESLTFVAGAPPASSFSAEGRIRYRAPLVPIEVRVLENGRASAQLTTPQRGIAPGQSLVIYHGEDVLGGGIISK
jgi:tRNA-specific 2-thiouridylase